MNGAVTAFSIEKPKTLAAILRAGATCGVMDITAALIVYGYLGLGPIRLLEGIASGLIGPRAFDGGLETVLLGLCLHFLIAYSAASTYVVLSRWINFLLCHYYLSGVLYGVAVYFFMQDVVIPLSAYTRYPFSFKMMLIGVVIHIFCVGLPISLTVRRYATN